MQIALDEAIKRARHQISRSLRETYPQWDPIAFQWLVRALLIKLGYTDVIVSKASGDGGVDVRATLVGGGVARIRTCIQVKRQQSVGAPVVQNIRGALSAHEAGLLVTSGQFTAGAIAEAKDPQKLPIALVNGGQLLELLLEARDWRRACALDLPPAQAGRDLEGPIGSLCRESKAPVVARKEPRNMASAHHSIGLTTRSRCAGLDANGP